MTHPDRNAEDVNSDLQAELEIMLETARNSEAESIADDPNSYRAGYDTGYVAAILAVQEYLWDARPDDEDLS